MEIDGTGFCKHSVWISKRTLGRTPIPRQSRKEKVKMFFTGMAFGIMTGAAFGIGLMCCVVAGKREDQQMEQMRIRRKKQGELKTIHFRDMEGLERFSLLDGGKSLHDSRGRNERDWDLPLCGRKAGRCEWAGLGNRGIPLADGTQRDSGVSLRDSRSRKEEKVGG